MILCSHKYVDTHIFQDNNQLLKIFKKSCPVTVVSRHMDKIIFYILKIVKNTKNMFINILITVSSSLS